MDSAVAICFFLQKCRFFTVFFLNFGILRSSEIMLRGISRIRLISLALGILFSSEIFAFAITKIFSAHLFIFIFALWFPYSVICSPFLTFLSTLYFLLFPSLPNQLDQLTKSHKRCFPILP